MLFKGKDKTSVPQRPPGLEDFWVRVHVKLPEPIFKADAPDQKPVQGYLRSLGVRAVPSELPAVIATAVSDGEVLWSDTEWKAVNPETLHPDIKKGLEGATAAGIWFRSGRVFYTDPEDEGGPS